LGNSNFFYIATRNQNQTMHKQFLLSIFALLVSATVFAQETVRISGNVQDDKKEGLMGATVRVKGTTIGTMTDASGNYTLEVPKDSKTIVVSFVGFDDKEVSYDTKLGNQVVNVDMAVTNIALNQVVISASKKPEKLLDAPASITVIGQDKLERNIVTTPVEQLKTSPGVDVMRTGLVSSNVVVRGFNNIFSGSVLNVVDNRWGAVPSLRVNAYQLVPTSNLDYSKIEVVRGPASALYGPNASSGVIHIMTKSPLDQEKKFETTVAMTSGFTVLDKSMQQLPIGRYGNEYFTGNPNPDSIVGYSKKKITSGNIINPEIRHSGKLWGGKFGYKISGSYFQGQDYPNYDAREPYDGDSLVFGSVANGLTFRPDTLGYQTDVNGKIIDSTLRLDVKRFQKDFKIRKFTADGRIDIKPIEDITITINGGVAGARNVELTGLGAAAAGGPTGSWIYWYLQTRFTWKRLFVQYFINSSDAGNTFLIPQLSQSARNDYNSASPPEAYQVQRLVDKSKLHGIQVQHSWNPLEQLGFIYGVDVLLTRPNTNGTINGRFENRDNCNQVGGYLQGDYEPLKWLKLVAAFRVDYNSIIKNVSFSPRAAAVFKPAVGHNIRLTYNRAFDSPNTLNQFLDLSNGLIPNGINVRGIGNPYGWEYKYGTAQNGTNGVQFITAPYNSSSGEWITYGDQSQNAALFNQLFSFIKDGFKSRPGVDPNQIESVLNAAFSGISGQGGTIDSAKFVSLNYANFATTKDFASSKQDVNQFKNLNKINNSFTQTVELGYKGLLFNKLSIQSDFYWTRVSNYVSSLLPASGAVMFDWESYLGQKGPGGKLYDNLKANGGLLDGFLKGSLEGVSDLTNPSIVAPDTTTVWDELVVLMNQLPIGTITPNDSDLINSDFILTYQNLGRLDVFGIDFGFQYNAYEDKAHSVMAGGSLSWVNKDQIKLSTGGRVALNAPKVKASVTFDHQLKKPGFGYGLTFRYQMGYEANSAVYFGDVKPAYLLDARVSYRPNFYKNLMLSINVNNVANYQWQSFPGTPKMGTQFFARAQVTF
jgi:iron complex outermembrane receptor protein